MSSYLFLRGVVEWLYAAVVVAPTLDDGIKGVDERGLGSSGVGG